MVADRLGWSPEIDLARRALEDTDFGARHFRSVLDRLMASARAVYLRQAGEDTAAAHLERAGTVRPEDDSGVAARVDELAKTP